jgi:hypothetical protein
MSAFSSSLKRLAALAGVLIALTGCAQLPKGGAIGVGPQIQFESDSNYLYYSPSSPAEGDAPQQIVNGFLSAGNGPQNDYSVARSFLTTGFQPDWKPSNEVLIQGGVPSFRFMGESEVTAEISVSAVIDEHGTYQAQPVGTKRYLNFSLEKQAGQWRISAAPDLTVLIRPNFVVLFKAYQLYFFDQNHSTLVPDVRWFPSRTSTATHLVQALLQGPKPWMSGALAWDFPEGTTLNLDSVTVADGEARVDLSTQAIAATIEQLRYMKAQIKATLLQIPSVTTVTISINNSPQIITDLRANIPNAIAASAVTLDATGLYGSTGKALISTNSPSGALLASATDFALNNAADGLALLSGGSLYRIQLNALDKSPKIVDTRLNLLPPEFDSYGYLWSVGSSTKSAWQSFGSQESHRISSRNLLPAAVKAFSVSPDGARVAVLYAGAKPTIWVHNVKRSQTGQPLELGAGIKLDSIVGSPISVQWADAVNIAVLTKFDAESVRPSVVMLGGETKFYPVIVGGAKMVANLATPNILVISRDGKVYAFKSNSWVQVADSVRAVHLSTLQ